MYSLIQIFLLIALCLSTFELTYAVQCIYYPNYPSTFYVRYTSDSCTRCCSTRYPSSISEACCSYYSNNYYGSSYISSFEWWWVAVPIVGFCLLCVLIPVIIACCCCKISKKGRTVGGVVSSPTNVPSNIIVVPPQNFNHQQSNLYPNNQNYNPNPYQPLNTSILNPASLNSNDGNIYPAIPKPAVNSTVNNNYDNATGYYQPGVNQNTGFNPPNYSAY